MILLSITISLIYLVLIGCFVFGFEKIKTFKLKALEAETTFSVIVPFRNEAENLPKLIASINLLDYPKDLFEIIFVNDASEDDSVEIIENNIDSSINYVILNNNYKSNAPKKDAISKALNHSKNQWITTTDADCMLPQKWLQSFNAYIQKNKVLCLAAPVTYTIKNNFLNTFQLLDILSLQGATIGGFGIKKPFLCNGANFAYQRTIFNEVHGFEGNTNTASGDDVFLLEKIAKQYPDQVHYLKCKDAVVLTQSQASWHHLIQQRIRWASKTSAYKNIFGKLTGLIVLLMNTLIVCLIILVLLGLFKIKTAVYIFMIKFSIDLLLIYKTCAFFNQNSVLKFYVFGFLLYPFFSSYVAIKSIFSGYTWKGRAFKS